MKKNSVDTVFEWAGWTGVVLILGSYLFLALGIIHSSSWEYHTLLLIGSITVAAISYKKHAFQPLFLNIMFAVIAVVALIRLIFI